MRRDWGEGQYLHLKPASKFTAAPLSPMPLSRPQGDAGAVDVCRHGARPHWSLPRTSQRQRERTWHGPAQAQVLFRPPYGAICA